MRAAALALLLLLSGCVAAPPPAAEPAPPPSPSGPSFAILPFTGSETLIDAAKDGTLFVSGARPSPDFGLVATLHRSRDGGASWDEVTPRFAGAAATPSPVDPILTVDRATGRVFFGAMLLFPSDTCGSVWWSDDAGTTWSPGQAICGLHPPFDHPFIVAAPPRAVATVGYPNVVHLCINEVTDTLCHRSLDGGLTWSPGTPAFVGVDPQANDGLGGMAGFCGGLAGPVRAGPDGVLYLPRNYCGRPYVAVSRDDGTTWTTVRVSAKDALNGPDPSLAADAAGGVHYAWLDGAGTLWLAASRDQGATWGEPQRVSPAGVTAHHPALAAGDGELLLGFLGTADLPDGFLDPEFRKPEQERDPDGASMKAAWRPWLARGPVDGPLEAARGDAVGPLVRGLCDPRYCSGGMADYDGATLTPAGDGYATYTDWCPGACKGPGGAAKDVQNGDPGAVVLASWRR